MCLVAKLNELKQEELNLYKTPKTMKEIVCNKNKKPLYVTHTEAFV